MLKIFSFLFTLAIAAWLPIIIFILIEKITPPKRTVVQRRAAPIPYRRFGKGSLSDFGWYLDRESFVEVRSFRDICNWLMGCNYVNDQDLFNHSDLWQHPVDFEATRQGDCEDHSLWAWRKLHELGIGAEFVVGKIAKQNGGWGDHTWIVLRDGSTTQVIETTAKNVDQFFVGVSKARRMYHPVYSVDTNLRSYVYAEKAR